MFLGHTNPKLWVSVSAVVLDFYKITEPSKIKDTTFKCSIVGKIQLKFKILT